MKENNQGNKRRRLLGSLLLAAAGILVAFKAKKALNASREPETIRLIGRDGKVVEIDRKNLPTMCAGKASNKRLFSWLSKKEDNNEQSG